METLSRLGLLVVVLGILTAPGRTQSNEDSAARSKILALEHLWNQAESGKDLRALDGLFDNELVYVDFDGTLMTKAEFLAHVKAGAPSQVVTESMSVQIFGDTAIATGVYRAGEVTNGRAVWRRGRFADTWVRRKSSWICIAAQATPVLNSR